MKKFLFAAIIVAFSVAACNNHQGTDNRSQADSDSSIYHAMPQGEEADSTPANPEPGDSVTNNAKGTSN